MSRELKFRAWDNYTEKMIDSGFHILGEVMAFGLIDEYIKQHPNPNDELGSLGRWNDISIQQFTGIKDKNGKDIYEDDICSYSPDYIESLGGQTGNVIGEIYWDTDGWHWESNYLHESSDYIQVIGNIFENPELLNE